MYDIRPATPGDFDEVVAMLVRLQADPAHHIGYHSESAGAIAEELRVMRPDWASSAMVAVDREDRLRGVLTVEVDEELGRAWLWGPFVDLPAGHPAVSQSWQATADVLLTGALATPRMARIADLELYGHRRNRLLAEFADRHAFVSHPGSRIFVLPAERLAPLLREPAGVEVLGENELVRRQVVNLHELSFPNRTVLGSRLVDGSAGLTVVVMAGPAGLVGFAAGASHADEYYVDFVAVAPQCRGAGAGRALVRGLLCRLAERDGPRPQAAAQVNADNEPSQRVFTALGFQLELELVSYRRQAGGAVLLTSYPR